MLWRQHVNEINFNELSKVERGKFEDKRNQIVLMMIVSSVKSARKYFHGFYWLISWRNSFNCSNRVYLVIKFLLRNFWCNVKWKSCKKIQKKIFFLWWKDKVIITWQLTPNQSLTQIIQRNKGDEKQVLFIRRIRSSSKKFSSVKSNSQMWKWI